MEKLLQKNYFLHQSAKDGYRSYLQSYASYSLKKIFDVNKLDLTKVGKAFGFSVPPRVNVNIGGGKGGAGRTGTKRKRDDEEGGDDDEPGSDDADEGKMDSGEDEAPRHQSRQKSKNRRIETLGKKRVDKEVYKKTFSRNGPQGQWSR